MSLSDLPPWLTSRGRRAAAALLDWLPALEGAEIGRHLPQGVAQEPSAFVVEMAACERYLQLCQTSLHGMQVCQWRQLDGLSSAARPRHLPAAYTDLQMSQAVRPASDSRGPAEIAILQDVLTGLDDQWWDGRRRTDFWPASFSTASGESGRKSWPRAALRWWSVR